METYQKHYLIKSVQMLLAILAGGLTTVVFWMSVGHLDPYDEIFMRKEILYLAASSLLPLFASTTTRFFNIDALSRDILVINLIKAFRVFIFTVAGNLFLWHLFFNVVGSASDFVVWSLISTVLMYLVRSLSLWFYTLKPFRSQIIIVGIGKSGRRFAGEFLEKENRNATIIGFVDDDDERNFWITEGFDSHFEQVEVQTKNGVRFVPYLHIPKEGLKELCKQHKVNLIITAFKSDSDSFLKENIYACRESGVEVQDIPDMFEKVFQKIPVEVIREDSFTFDNKLSVELQFEVFTRVYNAVLACIGLLVYGIFVFPIVYILMKLKMPGPMIYKQIRVGHHSKHFSIFKIRSMVLGAEKNGAVWAKESDDRILAFGKFMRKTRIDEFPQFLNVIKGDMNLVGPRPERPEFVRLLETRIPYYNRRYLSKPGITGWAQINYSYGQNFDDALIKLEYDLYYIKHRSFMMDIYILFRTVYSVLARKGI